MKPGYRTTEFVAMGAALVVAGLVAAGVLAPEEKEGATAVLSEAAMAAVALWGALRAVVAYIEGRTALKREGTSYELRVASEEQVREGR
jgi:uncharacterized membrane protein